MIRATDADPEKLLGYRSKDVETVDFYAKDRGKRARNQKSAGDQTYVISRITNKDIISGEYLNCTGSVFVGRDPSDASEIAFLTHQDPTAVLYDNRSRFIADFGATLEDFLARTRPGTTAYAFFAGNYFHVPTGGKGSGLSRKTLYSEHYIHSILLLTELSLTYLPSIEPHILVGPNTQASPVHVRFSTQERKLKVLTEETLPRGGSACQFGDYINTLENPRRPNPMVGGRPYGKKRS